MRDFLIPVGLCVGLFAAGGMGYWFGFQDGKSHKTPTVESVLNNKEKLEDMYKRDPPQRIKTKSRKPIGVDMLADLPDCVDTSYRFGPNKEKLYVSPCKEQP